MQFVDISLEYIFPFHLMILFDNSSQSDHFTLIVFQFEGVAN
jgi:hypothetical protein